jgi:poly-gamma-glutamate capsule biosynthesis protein CapA/YwtB (metallophosphatase superfamily)
MSKKLLFVIFLMLFVGAFASILSFNRDTGVSSDSQFSKGETPLSSAKGEDDNGYIPVLPSLDTLFADSHEWTATLSAERIRTVLVTGDIIPARAVNHGVTIRNNALWPYEKVSSKINSLKADIVFTNLETPLIEACPVTIEGMIFCGNNRNIEGLNAIGVDVASVANNHFGNHGFAGIEETVRHLQNAGITPTGNAGPVYQDIHGKVFAFLAYNDIGYEEEGINWAKEELIARHIKEAKGKADVVIVMFHWGVEYRAQPDDRQIYLAHYTIDQGADYVLSNHPHWIQPVELYKDKLIMYAHGNFIFDQMWSQKTREGVLGQYTFYDAQLIDIEFLPLQINDYGQAVFLDGIDKQRILNEMKKESLLRAEDLAKNNSR